MSATTALAAGTQAPDFSLPSTPDQTVSLRDFRGQPVILAFYPADWSPVCGDQMALYNEILPRVPPFRRRSCIGISVDGIWCHLAFAHDRQAALSPPGRLRAEGRGRAAVRRLPRSRRDQRAGAVRDRRAMASSAGATCRRSASIPAPTAFCGRSKRSTARRHAMGSDDTTMARHTRGRRTAGPRPGLAARAP